MNKTTWIVLGLILFLIGAFLFSSNRTQNMNDGSNVLGNTENAGELVVVDVREGEGREIAHGDIVTVHYVGTLTNGTEFDSSRRRNEPFAFRFGLDPMIDGWEQGLVGMKVGGIRTLEIPPELAYGPVGSGHQLAGETLHFEVELLDAQSPTQPSPTESSSEETPEETSETEQQ